MSDISTDNLAGAIESVDRAVSILKELHANGIAPSVGEMAWASIADADTEDVKVVLARNALMLSVALQKLADQ